MLHGLLGNYANTALAAEKQDHSLKQSSLWSTVINIPVGFSSVILLLDASNGYVECDHAWRLILSSGSKLA